MTDTQRMKSDIATIDRREAADKTKKDNRIRNDELTFGRRYNKDRGSMTDKTTRRNRDKNDESTKERRFVADKTMENNRLKNDQMTANRRDIKDGNSGRALVVLFALFVIAVISFFIFI